MKDQTQKVKLLDCTNKLLSSSLLCFLNLVVDEQNAHTEDTELPSPLEFRKDSEEENRDSEKDEDTREVEAVPCKCTAAFSEQSRPFYTLGPGAFSLWTSSKALNLSSLACLISILPLCQLALFSATVT